MSETKSTLNTIIDGVFDNLLLLLAGGLALAGYAQTTGAELLPQIAMPVSGELIMTLALVVAAAGYITADKIEDLLPDERGILIIAFKADESAGSIYELSEDQFADMEIHGGSLYAWDESPFEVYEVRSYDPGRNVAVGNWRESKPGSALAAETTVEDVLASIRELREDLEPDAAEARELQRRIRGIVRTLDKERAQAQQAALDEHLAPSVGDSRSISEIIESQLPDDMHPESMDNDLEETTARRSAGHPEAEISFDVLDGGGGDALEPVATDGGNDE